MTHRVASDSPTSVLVCLCASVFGWLVGWSVGRSTYTLCFKVVQTIVCQHEPTTLPGLDSSSLFRQIALLLGVGVCGVRVVELDFIIVDTIVQVGQIFGWQVLPFVDATVVADELSFGHFVLLLDGWVMCVGVEHDGREGQDVRSVGTGKHTVGIVNVVSLCKRCHHSINLLCLTW
jgi:hypothetical protein